MKRSLLATASALVFSSVLALAVIWPIRGNVFSQAMTLFASFLGIVCGVMLIGWWRAMYPNTGAEIRRRRAVYSLQFVSSFMLIMVYAVIRALLAPVTGRRTRYNLSETLLILSLLAMAHWVTTISSFLARTRKHGGTPVK